MASKPSPSSPHAHSALVQSAVPPRDEESAAEYNTGGYLQVKVDDTFKDGRYIVVRKLGWGHFSTVWLVKDTKCLRHSALKVVKSAGRYAETARDEIKLLKQIQDTSPEHVGRAHVVSFLDSFTHTSSTGAHVCITFEPLGENLLALIEKNRRKGVAPCLVKCIARQLLLGLQYLHEECDLVHTDIKPENILMSIPDVELHIADQLSNSPTPQTYKLAIPPAARARRTSAIPTHVAPGPARSVQIFESQPLRSPSRHNLLSASSSGSISSLAFTPRSPTTTAPTTPSTSLGSAMSKLKISPAAAPDAGPSGSAPGSAGSDDGPTVLEVQVKGKAPKPTGPSLLSRTAPPREARSRSRASFDEDESSSRDSSLSPVSIKIADLGNATPSKRHYTEDIQTRQYRSPEAILGRADWGCAVDVWSAACVVFELLTAEYLFEPQGQGQLFSKDDDHMAQIIELLGDLPASAKQGGRYARELFDSQGGLRYIKHLKPWPLNRVMREKYLFGTEDADALCAFLEPMLEVDFHKRARAGEMCTHPWLDVDWEREAAQLDKVNW
ncbi:kinase-like domain-containing protein [Vararia minispora EC-137]|uniref:Kinase-like domain-containing protein n=1 Tax=Vararia minispora EC-137 TaxID=1314806 RepID=A0ACB8Q8A5_9AGAM|nr:kinase-like domain-containing protein [Vararia minispora EC-137]